MRYHRGHDAPPALHRAISAGICEKEMQILARSRALGQTEAGPWFHNDVEPWACFLTFVYFAGTAPPRYPLNQQLATGIYYTLTVYQQGDEGDAGGLRGAVGQEKAAGAETAPAAGMDWVLSTGSSASAGTPRC